MLVRKLGISSILGFVAALCLAASPLAYAQTPPPPLPLYFPQTGHNVLEPFLSYFNATGGAARYGYPITESYTDLNSNLLVQYFQKVRMEWHPGNPDPYKVQLGLLGDQLTSRDLPLPVSQIPSPSDPSCHYFAETGQAACHKFLEFWVVNGGLDQFGYPITGPRLENGRIVQYFQRARMEWHPEKPENQRVQLAPLGQIYYDFAGLDRGQLTPAVPIAGGLRIVELRARGSVTDSVIARGGSQSSHVLVTDQLGAVVPGAAVTLIVHFPSGDQSFTLSPTDSNGLSSFTFPAGKFTPGTVISMEFIVNYGAMTTTTRTSYLMWFY